ncbi:beta-aspartyl-peptidase (threonine type) [Pontibacter aydingkolensis]|uniref:Isoaspartyl peptidase/L-asparaginase n=1 Tax=Pontibacter aydingkolensis TaxID=1911536 RepID=A0ABS7CVE4_9BACT|nr:isoaspartyl peptidase/L-asparaginase [Pontibacter aydingkolensis]MBW7467784.1 isoaspartyl peptidase/L-asparaginase [Pontibacter aydingkolensis]
MAKKKPLAIVVHGGADPDSDHIHSNKKAYEAGIRQAVDEGCMVLEKGGSAVDAVEAAVVSLENNPLLNAGRGSALNANGEVEMDAAIMRGNDQASGAVTLVRNIRNPISLAKAVMMNTKYRFLGDMGALEYAKKIDIRLEPSSYFITEHQFDLFSKKREEEFTSSDHIGMDQLNARMHGTVGAVALDRDGNLAAATSTGGTENKKMGRIGDSCIIGAGCYAKNSTCAISGTGDGELLIKNITAYDISALMEYKGLSLQQACEAVVLDRTDPGEGDVGVIGVDLQGNIALVFNSERMHRGWKTSAKKQGVEIYPKKQN